MTESLPGVRVPWALLIQEGVDTDDPRFGEALTLAWRLPKIELHLHLEGTLRPRTVVEMAPRYAPAIPFIEGWERTHWTFHDLSGFIDEFGQVARACVRTAGDYYRVAREAFEDLAAQHVLYADVNLGTRVPGRSYYLPLTDALAAIEQARRDVHAAHPDFDAGIVIGLLRHYAPEPGEEAVDRLAVRQVEEALRAREAGMAVVGIDLHGDEQTTPDVARFTAAFQVAAAAGLGVKAHAGEASGPDTVRASLRVLGARRIAHGVRSIEDPALVAELVARGVPLDVCPTSNVRTGASPSLRAHQGRDLHRAGVPLTISSDDPLVFDSSVSADVAVAHHVLGFSWPEVAAMQSTAARHCFQPDHVRTAPSRSIAAASWPGWPTSCWSFGVGGRMAAATSS